MQKAIIIDLDGTLYNCEERKAKYLSGDKKNFELFNSEHVNDRPNKWCVEITSWLALRNETLLKNCLDSEIIKIIFVSGRADNNYSTTLEWIDENSILEVEKEFLLLMRKSRDYRSDVEIKQEIYNMHIKDKYDILFAIDDRQCIVDMWRRNGIVCLQCAKGDF